MPLNRVSSYGKNHATGCPFLIEVMRQGITIDKKNHQELKDADVSPGFKKGVTTTKVNYRPISVLPSVSKIFERILKGQMEGFLKPILSSLLSGFREGYSTQHSLVRVIEAWRGSLDSSGIVGTILMDLSKAYDCIPHDLLIAKLEAYGFNGKSLRLMYSYLTDRKQRVKIGSYKSSQSNVKIGVPQGSVLGPLLFNIFLNDLFYMELNSEICNFADDNTVYSCGTRISEIMTNLENDLSTLLNWFYANGMVANPDKFQLMFLGLNERHKLRLNIEGVKISSTEHVKLLGIEIDNKLRFNKHVETLCDKTNRKVSAFRRLKFYLSREQAMKLCNTVIISSFNYCPLVWMFCGKDANHKINRTHKRALRILHNDYDSSFNILLEKSDTVTIHIKNLQKLMLEIFKSMNHLNPSYIWHLHERKEIQYDLRTKHLCKLPITRTIKFGMESLSFRGSLLWNNLNDEIKELPTVASFKRKIKTWTGEACNCKICK